MNLGLILGDPVVLKELISIICTFLGGIAALACRYHRNVKRNYERKLLYATDDIAFLLAVERVYLEHPEVVNLPKNKIKVHVRDMVREQGLDFSGKFTPGRVSWRNRQRGLRATFYRTRALLAVSPDGESL